MHEQPRTRKDFFAGGKRICKRNKENRKNK